MKIIKLKLHNFKKFRELSIDFNERMNIFVGDNEIGKSTILEAINLALSGFYRGRYLKNDLTHYIFNQDAVAEFLERAQRGETTPPPQVWIELWFDDCPSFVGNTNSANDVHAAGITYKIKLREDYTEQFFEYVRTEGVNTLPVEYYELEWQSFGRNPLTGRKIPLKSFMIDGSIIQQNVSTSFISHLLKTLLSNEDVVKLAHVHREFQQYVANHRTIQEINGKLNEDGIFDESENIGLSSDYSSSKSWEDSLIANINSVPLHQAGKGCQVKINTKLSLIKSKSEERDAVILIEEPESHLSFSSMTKLISFIAKHGNERQIFITTHSSFVLNKLGLDSLFLMSDQGMNHLKDLKEATCQYFKQLAGYETLRMLLAKSTILVEGDSDELILQKAYYQKHKCLPIDNGVDIQCIRGLSFLRYLELAVALNLKVKVVTDNDGKIESVEKKYKEYLDENKKPNIDIIFSSDVFGSNNFDGEEDLDKFNYNTLEPCMLKANSRELLNDIFGTTASSEKALLKYMKGHKSECALKIFETDMDVNFPSYINNAVVDE